MVYNLFLNDNFLKNPLMHSFVSSWQQAQTQQFQLILSQYQFWQRFGMQTLLASQRFWLPNTSATFGFSQFLPNTPLMTGFKPFIDPLLSPVVMPTVQTQANPMQDVIPVGQPKDIVEKAPSTSQASSIQTHLSTAAETESDKAQMTLTTKNVADSKKTINSVKKPRTTTKTPKKPVITADKAKQKPVTPQKNSQPAALPQVPTSVTAMPAIAPVVLAQQPTPVQSLADVANVKKLAVDINHATQAQLLKLNGINNKKAQDIIAYREKNQGFQEINDLAKVKGIGQSTVDKNRDTLTLTIKK